MEVKSILQPDDVKRVLQPDDEEKKELTNEETINEKCQTKSKSSFYS